MMMAQRQRAYERVYAAKIGAEEALKNAREEGRFMKKLGLGRDEWRQWGT